MLVNDELVPPAPGLPDPFADPGRVVLLEGSSVVRGLGGAREALTDLSALGGDGVSHPVLGPDHALYAVNGRFTTTPAADAPEEMPIISGDAN